jgi:hypothetical protein
MTTHLHLHPHPDFSLRRFALVRPTEAEWFLQAFWLLIILLVWLGTS